MPSKKWGDLNGLVRGKIVPSENNNGAQREIGETVMPSGRWGRTIVPSKGKQ